MIHLDLIGIGTGNPEHLTLAAIRAMNEADLILLPRKGDAKSDLLDLRRTICDAVLTGTTRIAEFDLPERAADTAYLEAVDDWHQAIAGVWAREIETLLPQGGRLALLVWGDPSLYDSSLRIAERLLAAGMALNVRVVPGITSIQALTAAHGITLNTLASPITITTGRRLRREGWPEGSDTLVVMLDAACAFGALPAQDIHIWWGAYLGMAQECLIGGPLGEVAGEIVRRRAALRAENGWIMDVYLLRKSGEPG